METKITQEFIDKDRRSFIDKVVRGSITGSLMLMIPMSSDLFSKVISEDKKCFKWYQPYKNGCKLLFYGRCNCMYWVW